MLTLSAAEFREVANLVWAHAKESELTDRVKAARLKTLSTKLHDEARRIEDLR